MPKPQRPVAEGHDDSAYGGQKFDVEKSQFPEDVAAPELQLNRKGLGVILPVAQTYSYSYSYRCMQLPESCQVDSICN